jgi:hypothetical protein
MSYQIGRKGKEYRQRCTFRNKPLIKGDYVVLPGKCPPLISARLELICVCSFVSGSAGSSYVGTGVDGIGSSSRRPG